MLCGSCKVNPALDRLGGQNEPLLIRVLRDYVGEQFPPTSNFFLSFGRCYAEPKNFPGRVQCDTSGAALGICTHLIRRVNMDVVSSQHAFSIGNYGYSACNQRVSR